VEISRVKELVRIPRGNCGWKLAVGSSPVGSSVANWITG